MLDDSLDHALCRQQDLQNRRNQEQNIFLIIQNKEIRAIRFPKNAESHQKIMNEIKFEHVGLANCYNKAIVALDMAYSGDLEEIIDGLLSRLEEQKTVKKDLNKRISTINEEIKELQKNQLVVVLNEQELLKQVIKNNRLQIVTQKRQDWKLFKLLLCIDLFMALHNIITLIVQVYVIHENASNISSIFLFVYIFFACLAPFISSCGVLMHQPAILAFCIHYLCSYVLLVANTIELFTRKTFQERWQYFPFCQPLWKFSYSLFSIKTIIFLILIFPQISINSIILFMCFIQILFWTLNDIRFYMNKHKIAGITQGTSWKEQKNKYSQWQSGLQQRINQVFQMQSIQSRAQIQTNQFQQ